MCARILASHIQCAAHIYNINIFRHTLNLVIFYALPGINAIFFYENLAHCVDWLPIHAHAVTHLKEEFYPLVFSPERSYAVANIL